MTIQTDQQAVVRVAVATLWADPDAVRPIDAPALAPGTDLAAWVAGMTGDQQLGDCVLSQLLLGERVHVDRIRDGWARVVAVEQPAARLDARGYPGWVPVDQLAPAEPPSSDEPFVVDAETTTLHAAPGGEPVLRGVVLGTRLTPAGPAHGGWRPVLTPGRADPLWIRDTDLAPAPTGTPAAVDMLAVASRLRDVVYVWGGVSSYGIDCSGLVHLAWRRLGVRLPRDASDQADATTPVPFGDERPGDLYFFARDGRPIHHIGIVTAAPDPDGTRRMLHACYNHRRVVEEPMPPDRTATLVAAHRV
ncbi:C40 family peptidase [Micromonospora zhanjiangensis]|uniref:NlpC/P60 family protein n=1 Tax=Micromonospora zhanjiangensis TaxID=1522057 RepID=A0ABV8KTG2_9ACTN